jgi:hypothetical protein
MTAKEKAKAWQEILSLCSEPNVPVVDQLKAECLVTVDETGYIHVDEANMAAALARKRRAPR